MGTVIDELIVELKLDPKQFDQATKDQVSKLRVFEREHERHSKKMAKDTDSLTQAFSLLQGRLLAIAGLFMGGMGISQFTEHITKLTVQTGLLAESLGLSTSQITKWQGVGATVSAAPGEMAQAIASVRNAQSDLRNGVPSQMQKFAYMTHNNPGPAVDFTKDTDPDEFMISVARWLEYHKKQGPQSYAAANRAVSTMLGFGQGVINALDLGPDELRKRLKEMEKFAPTPDQIKRFKELQEAFGNLEQSSLALGRAFVDKLQPTIKYIIELLDKLFKYLTPASDEKVKEFTDKHLPKMGGDRSIVGRIKRWWRGDKGASSEPGAVGGGTSSSSGAANDNVGSGPVAKGLTPEARGLLDTIAGSEANTRDPYNLIVGGGRFRDFSDHPRRVGVVTGNGPSTAAGRYQFTKTTWDDSVRKWGSQFTRGDNGKVPFTPENQDRMAWLLAQDRYRRSTGRDLQSDLQDPSMHPRVLSVLSGEWTSLPGGIEPNSMTRSRQSALRKNILSEMNRTNTNSSPADAGTFDSLWNSRIGNLGGAGAALRSGGGTVNNNSRSNQTHIDNMHVTVPPGADPAGYARGISQELKRYDTVMHANEGLL